MLPRAGVEPNGASAIKTSLVPDEVPIVGYKRVAR